MRAHSEKRGAHTTQVEPPLNVPLLATTTIIVTERESTQNGRCLTHYKPLCE